MRIDLKLTPEGDLALGQQQTDEEGFLLYYEDHSQIGGDIQLTREPSETTVPSRDVDVAYDEEADLQLMKSRLQTENPDWALYPDVGASLSDLIGELNNEGTAKAGVDRIIQTLTRTGAFKEEDLRVEAAPVSANELLFDIRLKKDRHFVRYALLFDFTVGLLNHYEIKQR